MDSRRRFLNIILAGIMAFAAAIVSSCGKKPDAKTEPSPEWPPKQ
jgi:hypothetical protein